MTSAYHRCFHRRPKQQRITNQMEEAAFVLPCWYKLCRQQHPTVQSRLFFQPISMSWAQVPPSDSTRPRGWYCTLLVHEMAPVSVETRAHHEVLVNVTSSSESANCALNQPILLWSSLICGLITGRKKDIKMKENTLFLFIKYLKTKISHQSWCKMTWAKVRDLF